MNEYVSLQAVLDIVMQYCPDDDGSCSKADVDPREMLDEIEALPTTDVQSVVYAPKTINVGRRSYCSNCGKLAIMEDFCSKCGAKVKDGDPTRNLTDKETEIYKSWIAHEAKDTGVNIMEGDTNG